MPINNPAFQERIKLIFIIFALIALILTIDTLIPSPSDCSWDFRISLWGPSYMLLHGQTPYTQDTSYGPYSGIWMPQLIGAFFIIGWLPCWVAAKIWFFSEFIGLLLMIWLVAGRKLPPPKIFGLCLLLIFFFPPLYVHFAMGQISILMTVLLILVVFQTGADYSLPALRWWMPLFLALGLAKPLLGVLVYPGLLVGIYFRRGASAAATLILLTAGWVALLIVPVYLLDPGWLQGFLDVTLGNLNILWDLPVPLAQMRINMGTAGIVVWALIFLACLGFVIWLWLKRDPKIALIWSLALTPIATPYCSSWDFVLMLPLMLWLIVHLQSMLARAVLVLGTLVVAVLQVSMRWGASVPDGRYWWVPMALLFVFIVDVVLDRIGRKPSDPTTAQALTKS